MSQFPIFFHRHRFHILPHERERAQDVRELLCRQAVQVRHQPVEFGAQFGPPRHVRDAVLVTPQPNFFVEIVKIRGGAYWLICTPGQYALGYLYAAMLVQHPLEVGGVVAVFGGGFMDRDHSPVEFLFGVGWAYRFVLTLTLQQPVRPIWTLAWRHVRGALTASPQIAGMWHIA